MRVILVNKFWYLRGGAEKVVLATKDLLEKAGHEVEIFGMKHPKNIFENKYFVDFVDYDNLSFFEKIKFGFRAIYNRQAKNNLKKLIKDFKPDVVHFHNIYHQLSCSVISAAKEMGVRTVMTLHDYKFISPNYNLFHHGKIAEECAGGKYYKCVLNNCMENFGESALAAKEAYFVDLMGYKKMIDKYICPSEFIRLKCSQHGIGFEKTTLIHYLLDKNEWFFSTSEGEYIAFVGRLSSEKGVDTFLESANLLTEFRFVVIGDGPEKASLEHKKKILKLDNVSFVGFKIGKELTELLSNARLVVVPSVWYEVSGLTILESQLMGKIVLGSNIGAIPESVSEEFLFNPKDRAGLAKLIKKWYNCPFAERIKIGEQLRDKVAEKHNPSQYLESLLNIYRRG